MLRGRAGWSEEAAVYRPNAADFWRVSDALMRIRATLAEQLEGGDLNTFVPDIAAGATDWPLRARTAVATGGTGACTRRCAQFRRQ